MPSVEEEVYHLDCEHDLHDHRHTIERLHESLRGMYVEHDEDGEMSQVVFVITNRDRKTVAQQVKEAFKSKFRYRFQLQFECESEEA